MNSLRQNGRKQGNERHHHTIANVVHDIEKLSGGAIWKLYLKIENTISKCDHRCAGTDCVR